MYSMKKFFLVIFCLLVMNGVQATGKEKATGCRKSFEDVIQWSSSKAEEISCNIPEEHVETAKTHRSKLAILFGVPLFTYIVARLAKKESPKKLTFIAFVGTVACIGLHMWSQGQSDSDGDPVE